MFQSQVSRELYICDIVVVNHETTPGAPKSLEVLKNSGKYTKKDLVILKLRENGLNYR